MRLDPNYSLSTYTRQIFSYIPTANLFKGLDFFDIECLVNSLSLQIGLVVKATKISLPFWLRKFFLLVLSHEGLLRFEIALFHSLTGVYNRLEKFVRQTYHERIN